MNSISSKICSFLSLIFLLSACSVAKLEARLEANPQCKDVINPKTGALMPCPGSDKAFYREAGLAPVKATAVVNSSVPNTPPLNAQATPTSDAGLRAPSQNDCKPQIHKKTGGTLPCPTPE
ncbi:hypothetical protein ICN19_08765 [Polynucleobacter sp. AP-Capit-er-40B-B4]|uniref:hypothetical protein n=1 Tax=Polynucleobacter sp. AP-Capit-er-40B-B4 TaxID=2576927 RepID=UPI001C0DB7A1|nr:hypothetical protein [Polynucleobacter sp. AP-Capit-er-40B-B4]MBU3582105.1 hypothetical protein [Polynucleobacter sp. AP-Capit-er-40B-B4]